jgi:hypothetical protein
MPATDTDAGLTVGLRVNFTEEDGRDIERLAELEERSVAAIIRRATKRELDAARKDGRL